MGWNCQKWNICNSPEATTGPEEIKPLRDFAIIPHRGLATVVVKKTSGASVVVDVDVPDDRNITKKETEKLGKFQDLRINTQW